MSKDPAILFYTSDFLTGTIILSHEQVGIYIRLLCILHQHGGEMDLSAFNAFIGTHEVLRSKFRVTEDDKVYHNRLTEEMAKRAKKSSSLSENAKIRWDKERQCKSNAIASILHMPIEDVNANENEVKIVDVFNYFCVTLKKKLLLNKDRKRIIEHRLREGRTVEELKKAIVNFSKDDWSDRYKYCDLVYVIGIRNKVDNLDRWLIGKDKDVAKVWPVHPKSCPECFGNGYIIAPGSGGKFSCREKYEN